MEQPRICIQNLGMYNEGILSFKWIDLPISDEDLEAAMIEIGIDGERYEEIMIADWEYISASEYASIDRLNEVAEVLEAVRLKHPEIGHDTLESIIKDFGIDEVESVLDEAYFIDVPDNMTEEEAVAYYFAENYPELQEDNFMTRHFNYDSWGRELMEDYYNYSEDSKRVILISNVA